MILRNKYNTHHLGEGALHSVGHGHSGWTHVSVGLYKVVNGPAHTHVHTRQNINLMSKEPHVFDW